MVYATALSFAVAPSSCTGVVPPSSFGTSVKGAKGDPSGTGSITSPHVTCSPTSSIWTSSNGMPNSSALLDSRSCPSQKHSSYLPIIHCGIGSYRSLGSLKTLYPPWQKWSGGLLLRVLSAAADLNLFKEEISWKGEAGGNIRPLKATIIWVAVMHPPILPTPFP